MYSKLFVGLFFFLEIHLVPLFACMVINERT